MHGNKAGSAHFQRVNDLLQQWEFRPKGSERVGLGLRNPLTFTGLVLAGANAGPKAGKEAGILSSEAIVELPLEGLRLAVLSACETGLGDLTEGEGVEGLARAFHLAGCPNVVASLWKVNDAATAALMNKFYHELWINDKSPAEALRLAQLTIYRHPDLIPTLAGARGRPLLEKAVRLAETAPPAGKRADTKLWAAFVLSGLGR
jgi:CHAT domain-containing protein